MTSSRWKRFAFFERNTLSLASEVLEDLIPIGGTEGRGSRRSSSAQSRASEAANDSVSLVSTTAALPLASKPQSTSEQGKDDTLAVANMWSSLNACTAADLSGIDDGTVRLPSQAQYFEDDSNVNATESAVDGLVLVFVASHETDFIHCFDVTVRCNPPDVASKDLEDMDGWRGYFAPLKQKKVRALPAGATLEDQIISEHLQQETTVGVIGMATCRASTGHRALHMACISSSNLVVCVDPHLSLSW